LPSNNGRKYCQLSHVAGNIAGKYFQQYAILMARLNVPLDEN